MREFEFVEDYILFIGGHDPVPGASGMKSNWIGYGMSKPVINLARYDVSVLNNFTIQIANSTGFTLKQADLACKIITKYQRQLSKLEVSVEPINNGKVQFKLPIREIDYTRNIAMDNDTIQVRFPFVQNLVQLMREFGKEHSQGSAEWDHEGRVWNISLTEFNTMWVENELVRKYNFEPSKAFNEYVTLCKKVHGGIPTLRMDKAGVPIMENISSNLEKFLVDKTGGFSVNNLTALIDYAGICQYEVDEELLVDIPENVRPYMLQHQIEVTIPKDSDYHDLFDYVERSKRFPVVTYDPSLKNEVSKRLIKKFGKTAVVQLGPKPKDQLEQLDRIPLLVTNSALVRTGTTRQQLFQRAEKTAFFYDSEQGRTYLSGHGIQS